MTDTTTEDPTLVEAHKLSRDCITYGVERAKRDWRDPKAQDAAETMAEELLSTFDHYLPADFVATALQTAYRQGLEDAAEMQKALTKIAAIKVTLAQVETGEVFAVLNRVVAIASRALKEAQKDE